MMNTAPLAHKRLYIAGPYRANYPGGVEVNVASAVARGAMAAMTRGWTPIIPHVMFHDFSKVVRLPDQYYLDATMNEMVVCDAVLLVDGWQSSSGTLAEVEHAQTLGMDVFMSIHSLPVARDYAPSFRSRTEQYYRNLITDELEALNDDDSHFDE